MHRAVCSSVCIILSCMFCHRLPGAQFDDSCFVSLLSCFIYHLNMYCFCSFRANLYNDLYCLLVCICRKSHPIGGGGGYRPPVISQTAGPISKILTPFDSPVREISKQDAKFDLEVIDDVTGQVKVEMFDFSGLVTSAGKISMLSANEVNELAWIIG